MRCIVNTTTLAQELRLLNQVAAAKTTLPILTNILIRGELDHLSFAATDLEIAFTTSCRAQVDDPGVITLPAKRLLDLVEQLPDTDVQIVNDRTQVVLQSGSFRWRLQTMDPSDFPTFPDFEGEVTLLPTALLQQMIGRVRYAVSEKGKYTVNGALLTLTEKVAALVATDGKRLAVATMSSNAPPMTAVIPAKALDALSAMFTEQQIEFSQGERHLFFQAGNRLLVSRMLEATFPAYERIIPRDNTKKAIINRSAFAATLRRVGLVSEENMACYFSFNNEMLDVTSASANAGDAAERLQVDYAGDPIKVCCSWKFVLEFLEAASGQTVTLELKDANSPMKLTDGENHLAIIMLMR